MRIIIFLNNHEKIQKLMIFESSEGVYLFGYDCLNDTSCIWDLYYDSVEDGLDYCNETFGIEYDSWIEIANPQPDCQHDFILPTKKIKSSNRYQSLIAGKWVDNFIADTKEHSYSGLTGNERLFITGLMGEFDLAKTNDKEKAQKILIMLGIC